ncbi:ATP-binding protein [Bifidobacterium sp.]|jgi:predicted HTH transcriptional regulator|uniref:ATP-binding protein n=1 Tax=Bifidobacterium sp. TaxID=41200 RepID=UPI0025BA9094|nr:ATP-binding protein [Bifidobacterium sp.]MCH4209324.1 transcriptional regulator [Bifidobacterium sp.]MCI1224118.1 transcriptional regulator [Bifidobacterium sp.]
MGTGQNTGRNGSNGSGACDPHAGALTGFNAVSDDSYTDSFIDAVPHDGHDAVRYAFDSRPSCRQDLSFDYAAQAFASAGMEWSQPVPDDFNLRNAHGAFTNVALLISDQNPFTVKCAVFSDDTKTALNDRLELQGSVLREIDEATLFLNRHDEDGEWPAQAVHEALSNALLHRDYGYSGPTLVNVFANRIEIVSLGGLVQDLGINDLLNGICQPRNSSLAHVFNALSLSENYGTGIPRIMDTYAASLSSPQLRVGPSSVAMILPKPVPDRAQPDYGTGNDGDETRPSDRNDSEKGAAARSHAKRYAFPAARPYITHDHAQALAGARVIGAMPLATLILGGSRSTTHLAAAEQPAAQSTLAQQQLDNELASYPVHTLEEVTLHLMADTGVALVRKDLEQQLGLNKNQAAYLLRSLAKQGKIRKIGQSRATRYYLN